MVRSKNRSKVSTKSKRSTVAKKPANLVRSKNSIVPPPRFSKIQVALIASLLAMVAIVLALYAFAATSPNWETEGWTVNPGSGAIVKDDASASNGKYLEFLAPPQASGFVHPGIMVSKNQLDFVKGKVAAGAEPWKSALDAVANDRRGRLTYTPRPVPKLMCSVPGAIAEGFPQAGCPSLVDDSSAAYTQALLWYYTGNEAYAKKSIEILNAWANTLKEIPYDQPRRSNGDPAYWQNLLTIGWSAETMTRGAEIIRHTYNVDGRRWNDVDIAKTEAMFKEVYYPVINQYARPGNGNGGITWAESAVNIGIFTNDKTIYDDGLKWWRTNTKAVIYMPGDGVQPAYPSYNGKQQYATPALLKGLWYNPSQYIAGLEQETCRDMGHTMMGLGPVGSVAETALIQGVDLYGEQKDRIITSFELNTGYINQMLDQMKTSGQSAKQVTDSGWAPTNWVCPDFKDGGGSAYLGSELVYNHYANRLGISMPKTKTLADRVRRPGTDGNHLFWETLTSYGTPFPQ